MPPELTVFFTAMTPLLEIKLAIPVGLKLGLSTTSTLLFATAGNLTFSAVALGIAPWLTKFARTNSQYMDQFAEKLFAKTRKHHSKNFERYGSIIIMTLVAVPLPGSGAGMGALIAFVFGLEYWKTMGLLAIGDIIAAMLLVVGFDSFFKLLDVFV
ncbi:small multi-drug export protein [Candidatus Gracilibacteria bacterium]|nr:small multi-drug export protein [Candidatus Gracilibacteria bacterium]